MKERPILFSAPMVRAILEGRKTQTRRLVKPQPSFPFGVKQIVQVPDPWHDEAFAGTPAEGMGTKGPRLLKWHCEDYAWNLVAGIDLKCKYGLPGDRLWVKETFNIGRVAPIYKADNPDGLPPSECTDDWNRPGVDRWRPSIHMPRVASRITLEVVSVQVERLQEISEADAIAEGCGRHENGTLAVIEYSRLWDEINGPGSWAANPWVWVLEFQRVSAGGAA